MTAGRILTLCGGVGGAKLALGLSRVVAGDDLVIACNVGDDFTHLGLEISPDIDTVLYTLAGLANPALGWGRRRESWKAMKIVEDLDGQSWFRLGDGDLGLHLVRTDMLRHGHSLTSIVDHVRRRLRIAPQIAPVTNEPVRTLIGTDEGELAFQHYFVRRRCEPAVRTLRYAGAEAAQLSPPVRAALDDERLAAIILCPSNPYLSLGPMLAIPALDEALRRRTVPSIAVSPVIGGKAVKGPTAKIMAELGVEPSVVEVARYLQPWIDTLVIDDADADRAAEIGALGVRVVAAPILMTSLQDRRRLAKLVINESGVRS